MNQQPSLKVAAVRGGTWSILQLSLSKGVSLLSTVVLLCLLSPNDVSTYTLASSAQALVLFVSPLAISDLLLASGQEWRQRSAAAVRTGITFSCVSALCLIAIGWSLSRVKHNPAILAACFILAIRPFAEILSIRPLTLLREDFRFRFLALTDLVIVVSAATVSIVLACGGCGYLSLLATPILVPLGQWISYGAAANTALSQSPRLATTQVGFSRFATQGLAAAYLHGVAFFSIPLLLGLYCTDTELGWYWSGFTISTTVNGALAFAIGNLLQPLLLKVEGGLHGRLDAFLRTCRVVASIAMPLAVMQALLVPALFELLPPSWRGSEGVTALLCVGQAFFFPVNATMAVLRSQHRMRLLLAWTGARLVLIGGSMFAVGHLCSNSGVSALWPMACVAAMSHLVLSPIGVMLCRPWTTSNLSDTLLLFLKPSCTSLIATLPVLLWWQLLSPSLMRTITTFMIVPPIFTLTAIFSTRLIDRATYDEGVVLFQSLRRSR
jgi:O-antigen/teichoic acid export membrane protein